MPADAQPTEAEREVWEQVDVVLKDAKGILDELQAYKGAGAEIREVPPAKASQFSLQTRGGQVVAGRGGRGEGGCSRPQRVHAAMLCPSSET